MSRNYNKVYNGILYTLL